MQIAFVAATLSKWVSFGLCQVKRIHGFNNQGSAVYIQLFEQSSESASTIVSNSTVPTFKSLLASANNGFDYDFGMERPTFAELCIALSSTETSLTAVGAGAGLDMTVDIDGLFLVDNYSGLTVVGDLTTSVDHLQIWSESAAASARKTLVRIDAKAVTTGPPAANYIVGYAVDTPASTNRVLFGLPLAGTSTIVHNSWARGELVGLEELINSSNTVKKGLTVQVQSVATAEANEGLSAKIRAMYY